MTVSSSKESRAKDAARRLRLVREGRLEGADRRLAYGSESAETIDAMIRADEDTLVREYLEEHPDGERAVVGESTDDLAMLHAAARRLEKTSGLEQRYGIHDGLWFSRDDFTDMRLLITAWIREHPEDAPNWYSPEEIYDFLKRHNYSDQIAKELSVLIAPNWQLAFNKGFSMGESKAATETTSNGG